MRVILTLGASALLAGTALAADLPARMPIKAPAKVATAWDWTGSYVGAYAGIAASGSRRIAHDTITICNTVEIFPDHRGFTAGRFFTACKIP